MSKVALDSKQRRKIVVMCKSPHHIMEQGHTRTPENGGREKKKKNIT